MADTLLLRKPAFGAAFSALTSNALRVTERSDVSIVSVHTRADQEAAQTLAKLDFDVSVPGRFSGNDSAGAIGVGPSAWLLLKSPFDPLWGNRLRDELGATCAVTDQSGSYAIARIEGAEAPALLAKGAYLDLHPAEFRAGSAAVALCGHIPAIIWRPFETLTYDVAVFRSYAGSFAHWLTESVRLGFPQTKSVR